MAPKPPAEVEADDNERPPGPLLKPCPTKLKHRLKHAELPPRDLSPQLLPLMLAAANGAPQRVTLRFHHPLMGCWCPPLSMSDYDRAADSPDDAVRDGRIYDWALFSEVVYAKVPDGLVPPARYEMSKYVGSTEYELTGYFSGRAIDYYGRVQGVSDPGVKEHGGEEESDRRARYPEFCVEDWCYRPDPKPGRYEPKEDRSKYAKIIAEMRRDGAKVCPGPAGPALGGGADIEDDEHDDTQQPR